MGINLNKNNIMRVISALAATLMATSASAAHHIWNYGSSQFILNSGRVTWHQARSICHRQRGILAHPNSRGINNNIAHHMRAKRYQHAAWIGLNDMGKERSFVWNGIRHQHHNGQKYRNWYRGEPNNWGRGEDCTEMYAKHGGGQWNDLSCNAKRTFLCQRVNPKWAAHQRRVRALKARQHRLRALHAHRRLMKTRRSINYGTQTFTLFKTGKTWHQARQICRSMRGQLAHPNRAQNFWMGRQMRRHGARAAWIGYNDIKREKHWVWSGNKRNNFRSWNRGEPNNYRTEDCVEMFTNGKWNDLACRARRHFVCQRTNHALVNHYRRLRARRAAHARRMRAIRLARLRALHAKRRAAHAKRLAAIRRARYLHARRLAHAKRMKAILRARRARAAKLAKRRAYLARLRAHRARLAASKRARYYKALRARQARARALRARRLAHARRMRAIRARRLHAKRAAYRRA